MTISRAAALSAGSTAEQADAVAGSNTFLKGCHHAGDRAGCIHINIYCKEKRFMPAHKRQQVAA
jgi:hypothetical protein